MSDRALIVLAGACSAVFLACILLANYVTSEAGLVPVFPDLGLGLGLSATAGTYFAGLTFVLRDTIQDVYGKLAVVGLILVGAVLSYAVADPFIATASAVAFGCSEVADLLIYTPLRSRGYVRAAVASNIVGALVDTLLFLWIAGFGLAGEVVAGQLVGKLLITAAAVLLVLAYRARRTPVTA